LTNTVLGDFLLSLAPLGPARVGFVPTASAATYLNFYSAFAGSATADFEKNVERPQSTGSGEGARADRPRVRCRTIRQTIRATLEAD